MIQFYMPNITINSLVFLFVAGIIYNYSFEKKDNFLFLIIIYFCSHFEYAGAQSGIFNNIAFALLAFLYFSNKLVREIKFRDNLVGILIAVLIGSNILGWVLRNNGSSTDYILGISGFFGYILVFNMTRKTLLTPDRIRVFIAISVVLFAYSALITLNQRFTIIPSSSPMVLSKYGQEKQDFEIGGGTLSNSDYYGELGLFMFAVYLPFLFSSETFRLIKIKYSTIVLGTVLSVVAMLVSISRSVIILAVINFTFVFFFSFFGRGGSQPLRKYVTIFLVGAALVALNSVFKYTYVFNRLQYETSTSYSVTGVLSGEDINRVYAMQLNLQRYNSESWLIGYGWSTNKMNKYAWFDNPEAAGRSSPHNLYFGILFLFGWFGSIAFVLLVLITIWRMLILIRHRKKLDQLTQILSVGFYALFILFIINQFKADIIYGNSFFMVFWIWLGIANSLYYSGSKQIFHSENPHLGDRQILNTFEEKEVNL